AAPRGGAARGPDRHLLGDHRGAAAGHRPPPHARARHRPGGRDLDGGDRFGGEHWRAHRHHRPDRRAQGDWVVPRGRGGGAHPAAAARAHAARRLRTWLCALLPTITASRLLKEEAASELAVTLQEAPAVSRLLWTRSAYGSHPYANLPHGSDPID